MNPFAKKHEEATQDNGAIPVASNMAGVSLTFMLAVQRNRANAEEAIIKNAQPGQLMPDGTIYLGRYRPKDRDGKSLAKTFNVFAAPEDLPEIMTYNDTVKHIAGLKKWHGYDGTNYATDKEFYAAVKNGSYNGGWIIPTCNVLYGQNVDGNNATPNNILAHMDKGLFKGTFKMIKSRIGSDFPGWYWSSTESRDDLSRVWVACLSVANGGWGYKGHYRSSCRPVRLVEVKMGG